jgi:hypothetical protein
VKFDLYLRGGYSCCLIGTKQSLDTGSMIKKIDCGKTNLEDIYQVFKLTSAEQLESKKARLFPSGNTDNEVSTTSIFLSTLTAVKEYREELLSQIGIKKICNKNVSLHTFTELESNSKDDRPDGLIVLTSGKLKPIIEWVCFVEVKIGNNPIDATQVDRYATFAREVGVNNIITISNDLVTNPMQSPVKLSKRSFNLYHWSWAFLKVTAQRLIRTNSIEDEDHIYILSEFRRYVDSHKKLHNYTSMGKEWKESTALIQSLDAKQKIAPLTLSNIVESYIQEEKDIGLQLTDRSQFHIELLTKGDRKEAVEKMLQTSKVITSQFMLDQDKSHTFSVDVDFIRQEIRCYTNIIIEKGKAQAQTTALIKMFESESGYTDCILVNAIYLRNKSKRTDTPLSTLFEEKELAEPYSILEKSFGDNVKFFEVKTKDLLGRDFRSTKNFIVKLEAITERFLEQVVVHL